MLPGGDTQTIADEIYRELTAAGVEVLYDDRDERAGVKFNDADLIGIPLRLTVSGRSLQNGGLEFKRRDSKDSSIIAREAVVATMRTEIQSLMDAIHGMVVEVPYRS